MNKINIVSSTFCFFIFLLLLPVSAQAAVPGDADEAFGNSGVAMINAVGSYDVVAAIEEDASGRLVTAGYTLTNTGYDLMLTRTLADGAPDTSFGNGGVVVLDINGGDSYAKDMLLLGSGKILVTGTARSSSFDETASILLARFNVDGSLDFSFGQNGIVLRDSLSFSSEIDVHTATLDASGNILVAGSSGSDFLVARFLPDGGLDASFNGGITLCASNALLAFAYDMALQSTGSIILSGFVYEQATGFDGALKRILPSGTCDTTFGGSDGIARLNLINKDDFLQAIVINNDDSIVAAGDTYVTDTEVDLLLAKYDANGNLDTSFNTNGYALHDFGELDDTYTLLKTTTGFFVAGHTDISASDERDILAAWFDANGNLDTGFGAGSGFVISDINNSDDVVNDVIALTSGGYAVAVKSAATDFDVTVAQLNAGGVLDTTFSADGWVAYNNAGSYDYIYDITSLPDDRLLAAGYTFTAGYGDFFIAQTLANGELDTAFGNNGIQVLDIEGSDSEGVRDIARGAGEIALAGYALVGGQYNSAIASLSIDGNVNTGFGDKGAKIFDFGHGQYDQFFSAALQPDGSIIAAGYFLNVNSNSYDILVARILDDGSLDTSFASNGIYTLDISGSNDYALAVRTDSMGNIYIAGGAYNQGSEEGLIMKLLPDGTLDTSFGQSGIILLDIGGNTEELRALLVNDNYLIAGGYTSTSPLLLKMDLSGQLDTSFDSDGVAVNSEAGNLTIDDLALDPNGRILVVSRELDDPGATLVARYLPDGSFDDAYSPSVFLSIDARLFAVAAQSTGDVVVAGYSDTNTDRDAAIWSYKSGESPTNNGGDNDNPTPPAPTGGDGGGSTGLIWLLALISLWWMRQTASSPVRGMGS